MQFSKDSPNEFRRLRRRENPPAKKFLKCGGAAPITISNFSLLANPLLFKNQQVMSIFNCWLVET